MDIQTQILTAIKDFVQNLNTIKDSISQELKLNEDENTRLRVIIAENIQKDKDRETKHQETLHSLQLKKDELGIQIQETNKLNKDLAIQNNEIEKSVLKQKEFEKTASDIAKQKEVEIQVVVKQKKDLQDKLNALKVDFEKLEEDRKKLNTEKNEIEARKRANLTQESKNITEEQRLAELELDLKGQQKRIDFELKKIKLNG